MRRDIYRCKCPFGKCTVRVLPDYENKPTRCVTYRDEYCHWVRFRVVADLDDLDFEE